MSKVDARQSLHNIQKGVDHVHLVFSLLFFVFCLLVCLFVFCCFFIVVGFFVFSVFDLRIKFMVFNATFNNISVISGWSVLLCGETGVFVENHRSAVSHWHTLLSHNVVHLTTGFELTILVVIGTDCTCNCKSNYHTITTTTTLQNLKWDKMTEQ